MTNSFSSIKDALVGISTVSNGETIKVAEENISSEAKKGIVELIEIAANRQITIKFEGEKLQKESRLQLLSVSLFVFGLCFAPTLLQPLTNVDGMSILVIQGIWVVGLAKAGLLKRIGIHTVSKAK